MENKYKIKDITINLPFSVGDEFSDENISAILNNMYITLVDDIEKYIVFEFEEVQEEEE